MGTNIRPEISENKKYWISKHRYYELKHFCLQYPEWKQKYEELSHAGISASVLSDRNDPSISDPTCDLAVRKTYYQSKMGLVEKAAITADPQLSHYILRAVTEDLSYTYLKMTLEMPCSRDLYYDRYRRFFWILSNSRK